MSQRSVPGSVRKNFRFLTASPNRIRMSGLPLRFTLPIEAQL